MKNRHIGIWLFMLFCLLILAGCGKKEEVETNATGQYTLYGLNAEGNGLEEVEYVTDEENKIKLLLILADALRTDQGGKIQPFPNSFTVENIQLNEEQNIASLYFSSSYTEEERVTEILYRAALTYTLTQVEGIDGIELYVNEAPLQDQGGKLVGTLTVDSFSREVGKGLEHTTLRLYFATADGSHLAEEERDVVYRSGVSLERLVMENLVEGPETEGLLSTLPANLKINSISIQEGVCYLNLGENFNTEALNIRDEIILYSVVNSLSELSGVSKVQFLINGESTVLFRESISLGSPFSYSLEYMEETT